jgi:hypothetical protein
MRKIKMNQIEVIATGDEFYSLSVDPQTKLIDGEEYVEVTSDFKRFMFIKKDSTKKIGTVIKNVP